MTASPPLLAASGIAVRAGAAAMLRDVTFALTRGRILGLIGESGAGKSMIGRVIAGQLPPGFAINQGTLAFEGADLLALSLRQRRELLGRRIAFIPQEPMAALNPALTVGRHFEEHLGRLGAPKRERRAMAIAALAEMRLRTPDALYDAYPFQLSGGMCQRVLIALAFASNPDLVIADEPTASLDLTTQAHIIGLLRRLQERHGTAVLFITHQLTLALHLCDDIAVLYAGEIVEQGAARDLFGEPRHPYTRALLVAHPRFHGAWAPLASPAGRMPSLKALATLSGCRFAPRCGSATAACLAEPPPLVEIETRRALRCIRFGAEPLFEADRSAEPPIDPAASHTARLVHVENLTKTFRPRGILARGKSVPALKNVSLSIAPGEFVGVVGESGSGKSTLGRLIMGLEGPTSGRIFLDDVELGDDASHWDRRIASIQLVFQDPRSALNPRREVARLVTQPLSMSDRQRGERSSRLLQEVGLSPDLAKRLPGEMSGGQRQRVNIARALCNTPRLLIADEIASGLDVSVQAQILNLLLRLRKDHGIALLMISHDLAVVRYLCSRVLVMSKGEVVESGPTDAVFSSPQHPYTRALIEAMPPEDASRPWLAVGERQAGVVAS